MVEDLGLEDVHQAMRLQSSAAFREHDLVLHGLSLGLGFNFDKGEYWAKIRGNPSEHLCRNVKAVEFFHSIPHFRKLIFTNCAEKQAMQTLTVLGLETQFEEVYSADFTSDVAKPNPRAFERVIQHSGLDPHRTIFFDDRVANLITAQALGFTTVLVSESDTPEHSRFMPDATISEISAKELHQAFPDVF